MTVNDTELWERLDELRRECEERDGYLLEATANPDGVMLCGNPAGLLALASQLARIALEADPDTPIRFSKDAGLSGGTLTLQIERADLRRA